MPFFLPTFFAARRHLANACRIVTLAVGCSLAACGGGGDASASGSAQAAGQSLDASAPAHRLDAASDAAWVTIASEGEHFNVSPAQSVRYGSGSAWITLQIGGDADCTNAAFGNDPAFGVRKVCQVVAGDGGGAGQWTFIASEGASFTVSGTQTVRYGKDASWITRTVVGGGECSNGFFGTDPLFGVVKECDVVSGTVGAPPPPVPTAAVCTPPVGPVDTSASVATVGDGSAGSCTEAALRAAVDASGVVKFDCGSAPATIAIATTIEVPATRDTVIDGGNKITLDGGGTARIFNLFNANYRSNSRGLTLQHIALRNAKAPGDGYVAPNPANPSCAYGYASGGGAAVQVRDARLHVIDVDFQGNAAASPGPDIGGGALYAQGSLDVFISGSRFSGNSGANAGAVGALQSNLRIYNSTFTGNTASGVGQNYAGGDAAGCPGVGHPGQGGAGGNGGAVTIDGEDDTEVIVCGTAFIGNHANELAGALFRTSNGTPRHTAIDRSTFQNNSARQGGALFLMNSAPLDILASTFSGNSAALFGAAHLQSSQVNIVNSTFSGNEASQGLAGALFLNGSWGSSVILNSTFADNKANAGPGYFSAAIFGDSNFPIVNTVFSNNTTSDPYNPMQCGFVPAPGSGDVQWPLLRAAGGGVDTPCVAGIGFADPLLGALTDNTGPTLTRLPAADSPLRRAGRQCPATDQRGQPRDPAACTIGAVE